MHKHSIAIMRLQPFTVGHKRLIDRMLEESEMVTLCIGSINKKDSKNPFTFHERKKMVKNVYVKEPKIWNKLRIIGLPDINDDLRWAKYVLDSIKDHYVENLEVKEYIEPTNYYAGSNYDGRWFKEQKLDTVIIDRTYQKFPYCSATMVRDLCLYQDSRWKLYVHETNWEIIEKWISWISWDRK